MYCTKRPKLGLRDMNPAEKNAIRRAQSDIYNTGKISPNTAIAIGGLRGPGGRSTRGGD